MRSRRVPSASDDGDGERVGRRVKRARPDGESAQRQAGRVVHPVNLADAEAVDQAIVDHRLAARAAFLRRLEDDRRRAIEVTGFGEIFGGAEQHCGMPVVAAGMHEAGRLRGVREAGRLHDRQRIHVGADADDAAARIAPPPDEADHPGAADPLRHLVAAEFAQPGRNDRRRAAGVVQKLWMLMEIAAPCGDLVVHLGNSILDRHNVPPFPKEPRTPHGAAPQPKA